MSGRRRLLIGAVGALVVAAVSTATFVNANASTGPVVGPPAATGERVAMTGKNGADLAGVCYLMPPRVRRSCSYGR